MHSNSIVKLLLSIALVCLATAQDPTIVVGPVIGYVSTTTARVLFEFDADATITAILTDPSGNQITSEKNVTANRAVPFAFDGLQPDTRYTLTLDNSNINMVESYFTTLSGESGKLRFAVSSCMDKGVQATKSAKGDLWANLLGRIQNNEIDYLLQTGDQVYMDDPNGNEDPNKPYFACMALLNQSTNPDDWNNSRSQCLEFFRNEYRKTWSIPSVREVLAKIPSLMIFDDHEVKDDWGYITDDTDPTSMSYFYGTLARQVYYEYQRQLREDINFDDLSNYTSEYFYLTLNDIGFFFLDYRGIRTWNRPYSQMEGTQLGLVQTQLLERVLDPVNGDFANLNHFFLVSPLTVVFLVEALLKIGYFSNNDAQESWSFGYADEQAQLLNTLRNWKIAKEGRDLVILDGDVHMGGYTDIKYDDDFAFLQFTTTSIASSAPSDFVFAGFNLIKEVQKIEDPWDYEHHDWTNNFNYGIVMANTVNDAASIQCYLVNAEGDTSDDPEIWNDDGSDLSSDDWQEVLATASV